MKILYIAGFRNEYNENIFIQKRKKAVISHFGNSRYKIDFLYNSSSEYPLGLSNAKNFYSKLLPCNVTSNFIEKTHSRLFKFSKLYSTLILKILQKKLSLKLDSYDAIIAESWEHLSAILPFVDEKIIIGRIYGTGNLTERIENDLFGKFNPFFNRMKQVVNSDKVAGIIFNSTGSRSEDLFKILSGRNKKTSPTPIYLDMPNALFSLEQPKKRLNKGELRLLQVGRMTDAHGFEQTITIVKYLINEHKISLITHLVGDGPSYNKIYELVKQNDLTDHIHLTGRLGLDELKGLYAKADVVINYYGFNPVIEALNHEAFVITREYGEIGKILRRVFNKKIYSLCLPNCNILKIEDSLKKQYVDEVVKSVVWYCNNFEQLTEYDFIPTKKTTVKKFAQDVFNHYNSFLETIQTYKQQPKKN